MSKARLVLLSLVGVVSAFALVASSASAEIKYEWKVGGKVLAAKETRAFTTSSDGKTFDFHSEALKVPVLILSKEISVAKGAVIIGGKPGTNEETVTFKGVTVDEPSGCTVESPPGNIPGTIVTSLLKTEIVESDPGGQPLILFGPKEAGKPFVTLRFLNKGTETCAAAAIGPAEIGGNLLAEPLPVLKEVLANDLDFEAKTKNFILSNKTLEKAGLTFLGEPASLAGLALVVLTTDEVFGPF